MLGAYYIAPKFKCQPAIGTGWFSYKIWTQNSRTPMVNLFKNLRPFWKYIFKIQWFFFFTFKILTKMLWLDILPRNMLSNLNKKKMVKLEKLCQILTNTWNYCKQKFCFAFISMKSAQILKYFTQSCDCIIAAFRNFASNAMTIDHLYMYGCYFLVHLWQASPKREITPFVFIVQLSVTCCVCQQIPQVGPQAFCLPVSLVALG